MANALGGGDARTSDDTITLSSSVVAPHLSTGTRDYDRAGVVRRLVDAWNAHDLDAVAANLDPAFENHQLPLGVTVGRDAYLDHLRGWFDAYPDLHVGVRTILTGDGVACLEAIVGGTRSGRFHGHEPSERREVYYGCDVFEFHADRIVLQRGYWDFSVATGLLAPLAGGHGADGSRFFREQETPAT